jgi:hypothetical protein
VIEDNVICANIAFSKDILMLTVEDVHGHVELLIVVLEIVKWKF